MLQMNKTDIIYFGFMNFLALKGKQTLKFAWKFTRSHSSTVPTQILPVQSMKHTGGTLQQDSDGGGSPGVGSSRRRFPISHISMLMILVQ